MVHFTDNIDDLMNTEFVYIRTDIEVVIDGIPAPIGEGAVMFDQDGRFIACSDIRSSLFYFAADHEFVIVTIQ